MLPPNVEWSKHSFPTQRTLFLIFRELFICSGACAATKRGMESLLGRPGGVVSVLVVGGAPESLNRYSEVQ